MHTLICRQGFGGASAPRTGLASPGEADNNRQRKEVMHLCHDECQELYSPGFTGGLRKDRRAERNCRGASGTGIVMKVLTVLAIFIIVASLV